MKGSESLVNFDRLCPLLLGREGQVKFSLAFSMDEQFRTLITGNVSTAVSLECQICLGEFLEEVSCEINTLVVEGLDELFDLDNDRAAFVAVGKYVSLQDIVEDELIVAIPMVPKHRKGCSGYRARFVDGSDPEKGLGEAAYEDTYRPFRDLALKYKGRDRKEV